MSIEKLEDRRLLAADFDFYDLNSSGASIFDQAVQIDDKLFFADVDADHGEELRVLDRNTNEVSLVADINPGFGNSNVSTSEWIVVGNRLFFSAYDPANGTKLRWLNATDPNLTIHTLEVTPYESFTSPIEKKYLLIGNNLFFAGRDDTHGTELRWFDVTADDPMIRTLDLAPGTASSEPGRYGGFANVGSTIYFSAEIRDNNQELHWFDTSAATPDVQHIDLNPHHGSQPGEGSGFALANGKLFFSALVQPGDPGLHWIDTTSSNAPVVKIPGPLKSTGLYSFGDRLFHTGYTSGSGSEIRWLDTNSSLPVFQSVALGNITNIQGGSFVQVSDVGAERLFFVASDPVHGTELRWIDALASEPVINTIDLVPGSNSSSPSRLQQIGDFLFASADVDQTGREIYAFDLLSSSTTPRVMDLNPGKPDSSPTTVRQAGNEFVVAATDASGRQRIQLLDLDSAEPQIQTIGELSNSSNSGVFSTPSFIEAGNRLFFTAQVGSIYNSTNFYFIDASDANFQPTPVALATPSVPLSIPSNSKPILTGNKLFTRANVEYRSQLVWFDPYAITPIWNVILLAGANASSNPGQYGGFTAIGNLLYFTAYDIEHGYELRWIDLSDQDLAVHTIDINPGVADSKAGEFGGFMQVGSKLFFTATDATKGSNLRWIDTAVDPGIVHTVSLENGGYSNSEAGKFGGFIAADNFLFFTAYSILEGTQLRWIDTTSSDPVVHTRTIEQSIYNFSPPGRYGGFAFANDKVYFFASVAQRGLVLAWVEIGDPQAELGAVNIAPAATSTFNQSPGFYVVDNRLYFASSDSTTGAKLSWIDTTEVSPAVHTISNEGSTWTSELAFYSGYLQVGSRLYFAQSDNVYGNELRWVETSEIDPVVHTIDVNAGPRSANPGKSATSQTPPFLVPDSNNRTTVAFNGKIYFNAAVFGFGVEMAAVRFTESPENLSLSNSSIHEDSPLDYVIGTLSAADPDETSSLIYSLALGPDSDDNRLFSISGNELILKTLLDFETKANYKIRVRAEDSLGAFEEKILTVHVVDVPEAPVANAGSDYQVYEGIVLTLDGTASTDPESEQEDLLFEWDINYDGISFDVDKTGPQPRILFQNDPQQRTIALRVTDPSGLSSIDLAMINVVNATPEFHVAAQAISIIGNSADLDLTVPFVDTGYNTWSGIVNYGNGDQPLLIDSANRTFSITHSYTEPGDYEVQITLTDDKGEQFSQTVAVAVTAEPLVEFSVASYVVSEAGSPVVPLLLRRIGSLAESSTVVIAIASTSASASDFQNVPLTVVFAPGQQTATAFLRIYDDYEIETNESLSLLLKSHENSAVVLRSTATVIITDNDSTIVTSRLDSGPGSLRDAILTSNATSGKQTITFAIPGASLVKNIGPVTSLPVITDPVIIDGTSQFGFEGTPLIRLGGSLIIDSGIGLSISAGESVIKGLSITQFAEAGIKIFGLGNNQIVGNFVGVATDGIVPRGNGVGILVQNSPNNTIGGTRLEERNIISGNDKSGVMLNGYSTTNTRITNNFIGTDQTGTKISRNALHGVLINGAPGNIVGGSLPQEGNVISGNIGYGVYVRGINSTSNRLEGNAIGTDPNTMFAVPNTAAGVAIYGARETIIGGDLFGRNVISGNGGEGIVVSNGSLRTEINLNLIGASRINFAPLPNKKSGVLIRGSSLTTLLNSIISNNGFHGIHIVDSPNNTIGQPDQENYIVGNGVAGVSISGGSSVNNVIDSNTIIFNKNSGIVLRDASSTRIYNNSIGTPSSDGAVSNARFGIDIYNSNDNKIGLEERGNTISSNGLDGIFIGGNSTGNRIRANSIHNNARLGINLASDGITPNDIGDADEGPNRLQNNPTLISATVNGTLLTIRYTVDTLTTNAAFPLTVDFYFADISAREGMSFIGSDLFYQSHPAQERIVVLELSGNPHSALVATATDSVGNTSEFSLPLTIENEGANMHDQALAMEAWL